MGISMPKFLTDGYASVKETYYSFKSGCEGIKESFKMAKTAYKMAKSLDANKFAETKDPQQIFDAINSSGIDIPESYKSLMKVIPEDTLKKLTNILFESLTKSKIHSGDASQPNSHRDDQESTQDVKYSGPDFSSKEGVAEAINRIATNMAEKLNIRKKQIQTPPPEEDPGLSTQERISDTIGRMAEDTSSRNVGFEPTPDPPDYSFRDDRMTHAIGRFSEEIRNKPVDFQPTQEFIDVDPPTNINYTPGYSEMKSEDDGDPSFSDSNEALEKEREQENEPFGLKNDNFYHQNGNRGHQRSYGQTESKQNTNFEQNYTNNLDRFSFQSNNTKEPQSSQNETKESDRVDFQNDTSDPEEPEKKELPPLTKMLGEELLKRYGPNWRQRVPSFIHAPEITQNIPDLGLGLGKESNRDMVISMSRVIKDLM